MFRLVGGLRLGTIVLLAVPLLLVAGIGWRVWSVQRAGSPPGGGDPAPGVSDRS